MRNSWLKTAILLFTLGAIGQSIAAAQAGAVKAISQTDVGFSVYGAYSGRTTGNGIEQSPSNAAGGIIEVRHIRNPLIGYEGTYSFTGDNRCIARRSHVGFRAVPTCRQPSPPTRMSSRVIG